MLVLVIDYRLWILTVLASHETSNHLNQSPTDQRVRISLGSVILADRRNAKRLLTE
jgi:hypothetical protein